MIARKGKEYYSKEEWLEKVDKEGKLLFKSIGDDGLVADIPRLKILFGTLIEHRDEILSEVSRLKIIIDYLEDGCIERYRA